jgi:hypothetical protein
MRLCIGAALSLGVVALAQSKPPIFTTDRVLPSGSARAAPLGPGMLISIYGANLGPDRGCVGQADTRRRENGIPVRAQQSFADTLIYPTELCGVQVLLGDLAAGLLYVQDKQINFKVPLETALEGTAELRVIYGGLSSSVRMPVGLGKVELAVEGVARVGGPIWVKVDLPFGWGEIRYPVAIAPADFGCNEIEVRQNGVMLPSISLRSGPMIRNGPPCGSISIPGYASQHAGRLPIHLQYRFEKAGVYEMRYTLKKFSFGSTSFEVALQSSWSRLEVLPAQPHRREPAPSDPAEILSDYLPGILGFSDTSSLQIVLGYLYHPSDIVRRYAQLALSYWPQQEVDARTAELIRTNGPTDALVGLLHLPTAQLTDAMLPYLASGDRILLDGAIQGVTRALSDPQRALQGEPRVRAENALLGGVEHILRTGDRQTLNNLAVALGSVHDDRARDVLWNFYERKVAAEQSLIAITWRKDLRDLPRLGALLVAPAAGDSTSRELASIPYAIRNSYGESALPFLEAAIKDSGHVWVRTSSARELVLAGRPAGFGFIVDAIEGNRPYRREMVEFARERFPELKGLDEGAVFAFVKARAL